MAFARAGRANESQSGFQPPGTGDLEADHGSALGKAWCLDWLVSWEETELQVVQLWGQGRQRL